MPEEFEVETRELQQTIDEMREEREERAREARETAWMRFISLSTALLAVIAAVAALQAGKLVNDALIEKNEAVLRQAQASDQWAYYQAAGIKSNTANQTADVLAAHAGQAAAAARWRADAAKYDRRKAAAREVAQELERQRDEKTKEAENLIAEHELFAYCVTCTQVAIALSAVAALTRRRSVWYFSLIVGVVGVVLFVNGYINRTAHQAHRPAHAAPAAAHGARAPAGEAGP